MRLENIRLKIKNLNLHWKLEKESFNFHEFLDKKNIKY